MSTKMRALLRKREREATRCIESGLRQPGGSEVMAGVILLLVANWGKFFKANASKPKPRRKKR
jgi:hypothetical protein